jgi:death-associated protein kinase
LSLYDHAGQKQFHKTHGLFFKASNALFLLLLSLVQGGQIRTIQELIDEAQYWLSFLRASLQDEFIPTVIMAASRADYNYPESQQMLQRLVGDMQRLFHGKVSIADDSFLLDCRKSRSPEMMKLRGFLAKTRKEYLEKTDVRYPRFYEPVTSRLLPDLRRKAEEAFMTTGTLITEIKEYLGYHSKVLDKVVDFLDDTGEVRCCESALQSIM